VRTEETIPPVAGLTRTGRRKCGRMDIFVHDVGDFVPVVEIKATDWDRIPAGNIQRNLSSHRRQV